MRIFLLWIHTHPQRHGVCWIIFIIIFVLILGITNIIRCGVYVTYRCLLHRDNFNFLINYSSDSFPLSIFSLFFYTIPNYFYRFFKAFLAKETVKGINVTQKQNQFPGKTLARLIPRKISPLKRSFSSLFDSTTKDTCLNHCNCTFLHYLNLKFG